MNVFVRGEIPEQIEPRLEKRFSRVHSGASLPWWCTPFRSAVAYVPV
jgi:hypothetical protein